MTDEAPRVLFGAFDRHNFGDLLLARLAALRLGEPCLFAGLHAADLRAYGGPRVHAWRDLVATWSARWGGAPLRLEHVGGELLDTTAWEAAVMLQRPDRARARLRDLDGEAVPSHSERERTRAAWVQRVLGDDRPLPYLLGPAQLPPGSRVSGCALGGVGWARLPAAARRYAVQTLAGFEACSLRDQVSRDALAAEGLRLPLAPDPAEGIVARVPALFGSAWAAQISAQPVVAVQFAAQYGDDASLDLLAAQLHACALPVVLLRAGIAPWHDSLEPYRRLRARLHLPARLLRATDCASVCALIATASAVLATSLHVRIVARAFGRTLLPLPPGLTSAKLQAYEATWHAAAAGVPA